MRIAVLDDWSDTARQSADWNRLGDVTVFTDPIPPEKRAEVLAPYHAICMMRERTPLSAELIAALPCLELVVTTGMRNLALDLDAARARGITVCGTQSRKTTTAELTMTLIQAQSRRLIDEADRVSGGAFQGPPGRDLANSRVGIVGLGNVGTQVARLCRAFGAEVTAWSPNLAHARAEASGVMRAGSLSDLAARSDVLTLHMVLSNRTRGLIGTETFAALPPNALVVNTSRAGLVDCDALFGWLDQHSEARAAIDVFDREPLPATDPWRAAKARLGHRLLLTPHLGYVTQATWATFYGQTIEAVEAYRDGAPIRRL